MKKRAATVIYSEVFAMYWGVYCIVSSFASVYLIENGYSNTEIGVLLAVGNAVSVFLQPFAANLADRSQRVTALEVVLIMTLVIGAFEFLLLLLHGKGALLFIAYVLMLAFHTALQPLLNSLSMKFAHVGVNADYGISRGIGSLGYSLMSAILGGIVASAGARILPLAAELLVILLFVGILCLKYVYRHHESYQGEGSSAILDAEHRDISMKQFVRGHILFLIISAGIFFLFYQQQIVNFFMLQIFQSVGGDSSDMGFYYALMSFLEIPALLGFSWLNKRISTARLLKIGVVGLVLRGVFMYMADSSFVMQLTLIVHPIGFPLFLAAIVKYINEIMNVGEAVRGQSLYVMVITLSAIVASFSGGFLIDSIGVKSMLLLCLLFCAAGAAIILPLVDKAAKENRN